MAEFFSYCDLGDVEGTTQKKYDAESRPSRTEANRIVRGVASEIDGVLEAAGYQIPVPQEASRALEMLRYYNVLGGAYRCWHAATRGTQTFPAAVSWREDYKDFLERIRNDQQGLPGIPASADSDQFTASITAIVTTD